MVIDINNVTPAQPGNPQNGGINADAGKPAGNKSDSNRAENSPTANDTVELSAAAKDLARIREALQNLPDVDESRIEQIREQIADGRYELNAEQIAERILADDQNFLL